MWSPKPRLSPFGNRAIAVTGTSASLAAGELESAEELAQLIGIRHLVVSTDELSPPTPEKRSRSLLPLQKQFYTQLERRLPELGVKAIVNGANADDLGDYRPGMTAASEHRIHSPLAECGINKAEVRELAAAWGLPVWDKPATPCLSSRIAYGEAVTVERGPAMIDRPSNSSAAAASPTSASATIAATWPVSKCRSPICFAFYDDEFRRALTAELRGLGFKFITLDLEGFKSGSLNQLVQIGQTHTSPNARRGKTIRHFKSLSGDRSSTRSPTSSRPPAPSSADSESTPPPPSPAFPPSYRQTTF